MKIQLCDGKVKRLSISDNSLKEESTGIISFNVQCGFPEENSQLYFILFHISIGTSCGALVDIEYESMFETEDVIDDDFKNSQFIKVNSPAIAYPYLRAYVSTMLTLSGYEPVILPTMNFQAMYNDSLSNQD